ncbi:hypothetical protein JDV02_006599 [Purpureocillium takamizusanense]|uniref:Uncharacterized protein n=1 Tax=Purpureocillium takamizusanense TaxID=2060973 RepID=A0A9Q8QJ01_9HYPO|nr:uncharacterized protein JDV02_006599 [Purpureocillium takamizusanense]UNI20520.1 hypothetical protein JDV02_006599 [Purpureocillium takamizusanense]
MACLFLRGDNATALTMVGFCILAMFGLVLTAAKSHSVKRFRKLSIIEKEDVERCHERWIEAEMGRETQGGGRATRRRWSCSTCCACESSPDWQGEEEPYMLGALVVSRPMEVHLWMEKLKLDPEMLDASRAELGNGNECSVAF